jgi:hypothetical protein
MTFFASLLEEEKNVQNQSGNRSPGATGAAVRPGAGPALPHVGGPHRFSLLFLLFPFSFSSFNNFFFFLHYVHLHKKLCV